MYSAPCPNCGRLLTSQTPGPVRIGCSCGWVGHPIMVPSPVIGGVGVGVGGLAFPTLAPSVPPATPAPTTQPSGHATGAAAGEDNRRAHTRQRLYGLASAVAGLLRTLDTEDWDLPLWRRYEHVQRAHETLFEALGGARMGEYRPQSAPVEAAVVDLMLWELLLLDGAEQRL